MTAALWCGNPLFEARVRGILNMVDKQRDSVKMTVTKALTAWLRTSIRDRDLPHVRPRRSSTTPRRDAVCAVAVRRHRRTAGRDADGAADPPPTIEGRSSGSAYPRIGMFLDELPNTPLPKILQYFAEARGLGVSICAAAQASSQLDVVYGALQGRAIRDVVPATLIMYGAHEEELMRVGGVLGGQDHPQPAVLRPQPRRHRPPRGSSATPSSPKNSAPATWDRPGCWCAAHRARLVELIEWSDFVTYLDELRGARALR